MISDLDTPLTPCIFAKPENQAFDRIHPLFLAICRAHPVTLYETGSTFAPQPSEPLGTSSCRPKYNGEGKKGVKGT